MDQIGQPLSNTAALPQASGLIPYQGLTSFEGNASLEAREERRRAAEEANNQPHILGLAGHVRSCWTSALAAKRMTIEPRMLQSMRQRRGEYDPEILAEIKKGGGSEIYMLLTSNKCRAAASWIRDVMLGMRDEKPWTISPSPLPDLPPQIAKSVAALAAQEAQVYEQATGQIVQEQDMEKIVSYVKDRIIANAKKRAREACDRMELKMEDQLVEGGFQRALGQFIEDIVTFPSAILKGPVVRNKKKLTWVPKGQDYEAVVEEKLTLEWDRVDPFMAYPMPNSTDIDDGGFIERHKMQRTDLNALIGVEGYKEDAIRAVLEEFGKGGLSNWLYIDTAKALVEGKSVAAVNNSPEQTIEALQFWGSVQGKMLIEWGMDAKSVPDPDKDYQCEVWLIDRWVIKAMLNPDPMGRIPYYKASYEEVPGTFWGNSVADLCRDSQSQCNTAARAIANNMGIASGPQVNVNVDRLPPGEDITKIYPWKIWQTTSDPYGSSADPVKFFMPASIAGELMQIYQFFSAQADEHTGVPRYMAGDAAGSGALRTSSGMSMLMNNAGKAIKQVIANIDVNVLQLLIERLWYYNMKYGVDPELKGDINVVARGANSLIVKETQQQRVNEFLQLALTNPIVNQIVGEEAIASLLRVAAKNLDMDTDQLVPPPEIIRARVQQIQQQQAAAVKAQQDFQLQLAQAPSHESQVTLGPDGLPVQAVITDTQPYVMPTRGVPQQGGLEQGSNPMQTMTDSGQTTGGAPVTDNFSPMRH